MQTWKWTELLQSANARSLEVTTTGSHSHVGSQALDEIRHRLVHVLLCSSSQVVCRTDFNSSVVIDFGWSLWCFSNITLLTPDMVVQMR